MEPVRGDRDPLPRRRRRRTPLAHQSRRIPIRRLVPLSAPSSLAPSPETEPSRPVPADPASTQPSRIRPCAAPKDRFTAYEEEEEEEGHVGVDGEMTAPLVGVGFVWEVNGDVRRGIYEPCPLVVLPPSDSREGTDVAFEVG